jgi:hypothetical protein
VVAVSPPGEGGTVSADNWTACPQCKRNQQQEQDLSERDYTFREDYEIGLFNDELFISYTGECQDCGFRVTFKHTKSVFE